MSIRKMTDDLNIISSLPNRPTETAEELKARFDEASNLIKNYINDILTEDAEKEIGEKASEITSAVNNTIENLRTSTEESINNLKEELESEFQEGISNTLNYAGFQVTNHSVSFSIGAGEITSSTQVTNKPGYYPLGIVGHANTSIACNVQRVYLSKRGAESATCAYLIHNEDYGNPASGTFTYYILWAKIS